jgi:hypothetical protein
MAFQRLKNAESQPGNASAVAEAGALRSTEEKCGKDETSPGIEPLLIELQGWPVETSSSNETEFDRVGPSSVYAHHDFKNVGFFSPGKLRVLQPALGDAGGDAVF